VLTQDCTNKDEFSSQENTLFKKWQNWDSTHRRKSADIIDPVQKQKFRKKQKKNEQIKDSEIRKRRNRKIEIQINEICQKAT
jgi:hypothetical protein